jgi:hypothetical protein
MWGAEDFDGDVAIVLDVVRDKDRSYAARAEFPLDAVTVGQSGGDASGGLAQLHTFHVPG